MLPPSDHVPKGYVRFKPDGPLFHREYLARHPSIEERLRAQAEQVLRLAKPDPEVVRTRAELAAAMRQVRYLRNRVEVLEHLLDQVARIRQVDPAEQARRDDVRRHPQAYTVFVLRSVLADLESPEGM